MAEKMSARRKSSDKFLVDCIMIRLLSVPVRLSIVNIETMAQPV